LGVGNALAFDAENLSPVQTANLLSNVTKSVIIHGFEFRKALEESLKEDSKLGRHTNVFHYAPDRLTNYVWAHKVYQPWGFRLSLQCAQCGILHPWIQTTMDEGYGVICKNEYCGRKARGQRLSFTIRKSRAESLSVNKDGRWLKEILNCLAYQCGLA
jgi:hypothetical protein